KYFRLDDRDFKFITETVGRLPDRSKLFPLRRFRFRLTRGAASKTSTIVRRRGTVSWPIGAIVIRWAGGTDGRRHQPTRLSFDNRRSRRRGGHRPHGGGGRAG